MSDEDKPIRYLWLNMDTEQAVSEKSLRDYAARFRRGGSWKCPGLPIAWTDEPAVMAYGQAPFTMAEVEALAKKLTQNREANP